MTFTSFSVAVANAGHSKIDQFLDRQVDVEIQTDADGNRHLIADVTLTNNAPSSGLPKYVIGNDYGYPPGTSSLLVSFYSPPGLETATQDGEPIEIDSLPEAGWRVYERNLALGPGESSRFRLKFSLDPPIDDIDAPVRWSQPLSERES